MQPTILLVDDVPSVRHVLCRAIIRSQPHASVLEAATFQEALQIVESNPLVAIVTDYHLPDGDGLRLLKAARHRNPNTPVFIISADHRVAEPALALGATAFFAKPLDVRQFMTMIEGLP